MLIARRIFLSIAVTALFAAFAVWIVLPSSSFQTCIDTNTQQQAPNSNPLNQRGSYFSVPVDVYKICIGDFTERNQGAITAVATFVIAAFTIVLTLVTNRQASATFKTAEAALAAELPMVFVEDIDMWHWARNMPRTSGVLGFPPEDCDVRITFRNHGRSVAVVTGVSIEHRVVDVNKWLPKKPSYMARRNFASRPAIKEGKVWECPTTDDPTFRLSAIDRARIDRSSPASADLWVYGYLEFRDFKGSKHRSGFCFRWHSDGTGLTAGDPLGFHADGPETYTYNT